MNIANYLKAGYPALHIVTSEPLRAIMSMETATWQQYSWDCQRGIIEPDTGKALEDVVDPLEAIKWLGNQSDTVLMVQNFHHFLGSVEIIQEILNSIAVWKASGCCFALVGPSVELPREIATFFTLLEFNLPDRTALEAMQQELGESVEVEINPTAIDAALGLTEFEAETAFALSLVLEKRFSARVVTEQKMQMIRRTGLMEFWPPVPIEDVGGLEPLKQYLTNRKKAFLPGNSHLPKPKALLLVGIPGTGKSLSCKAAASILGWPLIRLDISALKGSLVGESERRIRQATATIDAFGQAVVWMDELEKAFAGVRSSGHTDGGTTAGMFGHFLTWLQETTTPVLVMATANRVQALPPEFLRAGRFDALFFVDTPSVEETGEIIGIMNARYSAEIPVEFSQELSGWTGAEIEQLAKDSLFDGLGQARQTIVPLSRTMKEEIDALKRWAATRARRANSTDSVEPKTIRRIHSHVAH